MRFLVDAQLPRRLARDLVAAGHDAVHTVEMPRANRTPDSEIATLAAHEQRVVVTKDGDFVTSFLLFRRPHKLLLIATGNISNESLVLLFRSNLTALEAAFIGHDFVELGQSTITIHM